MLRGGRELHKSTSAGHGELAAPMIWVCFVFFCVSVPQGLKWGRCADCAGKVWRMAALRKLGREEKEGGKAQVTNPAGQHCNGRRLT